MITMLHSEYGDTPLRIYLSKNILLLKSYPLDFQVCNKAANVWWTCASYNNRIEHEEENAMLWKRKPSHQ